MNASAITVPDLGFGGRPVVVGQWLVGPGDEVVAGDRLAELLCDSMLFYAEAEQGGRFGRTLVDSGTRVEAGQTIGEMTAAA